MGYGWLIAICVGVAWVIASWVVSLFMMCWYYANGDFVGGTIALFVFATCCGILAAITD